MTVLSILLITLLSIIITALFIALFIPKDYAIERSIVIDKPVHTVFDYIKLLNNQEHYSKWVMGDPEKRVTNTGIDGTVGFKQAWIGKKAGEGEQEITGIAPNERITIAIRFVKPFKNTAHIYMATQPVTEHSTKVTWGMSGNSKYPINLMTAMMKGTLGNDMSTSLNYLKIILER